MYFGILKTQIQIVGELVILT